MGPATYNSYFHRIKDAVDLTIPKLNEMAYEQVEVSSVPFLKFVANKGPRDDAANYSSCCAVMSGIGWPTSGASTTGSS